MARLGERGTARNPTRAKGQGLRRRREYLASLPTLLASFIRSFVRLLKGFEQIERAQVHTVFSPFFLSLSLLYYYSLFFFLEEAT